MNWSDPELRGQVVHVEELEARPPTFTAAKAPFHPRLSERLEALGMTRLYRHQAQAYDAAMDGRDLVVVTGTNSGKTLCYNLPAMQWSLTEPAARALYLFPTKALAQDQLGRLNNLLKDLPVRTGTYDGDTPTAQRGALRRLAHLVLTNPDMLHLGILPAHELWTKFLKALRLIVIDEMHVYRGVFGSHVALVLRRLLRLCEWHGARPQIVACSATIGNPDELFWKLTGREPLLIDQDGSPRGRRTYVFYNPPELPTGERLSTNIASAEMLASLVESDARAMVFSRSRVSAELVLKVARKRLANTSIPESQIESYRAGYTPKERREIEGALFRGELKGLSATSAMELGVDVGGLDAVVLNGYPGSISSFHQQAGRAGRGTRDGLAIFVAHHDPLEQYLLRNPDALLQSPVEGATIHPGNVQILGPQLLCAAHERALGASELERFAPGALELAEAMDRSGELRFADGRFFYPSHEPPAPGVSIRGTGGDAVTLMLEGETLGAMEGWRAMRNAHEGAVYLHRGGSFQVTELDLMRGLATLVPFRGDFFTRPILQSIIESQVTLDQADWGAAKLTLVGIRVTTLVLGYRRMSLDAQNVLEVVPLEMPPQTFETLAVRLDLPSPPESPFSEMDETTTDPALLGVHGAEHALHAVASMLAGCDRSDLGSAWYGQYPDTLQPAVFVFDATPGGVGLCERLFSGRAAWAEAAYRLVHGCPCEAGCPGCLLSPGCEVNNDFLDKAETLSTLRSLR